MNPASGILVLLAALWLLLAFFDGRLEWLFQLAGKGAAGSAAAGSAAADPGTAAGPPRPTTTGGGGGGARAKP